MKPTELTKGILAATSFMGELASVMRANNVPLKKVANVTASKNGVTESASQWECGRDAQARLMLKHFGKEVTPEAVNSMEARIVESDLRNKAGIALCKAFAGVSMDALHKSFIELEESAKSSLSAAMALAKGEGKKEGAKAPLVSVAKAA